MLSRGVNNAYLLGLAAAMLGGCSAFSVPTAPRTPSPLSPDWSLGSMRQHISFLNGDPVRGRLDGTVGYSIAASYVADRFRIAGLQPAIENQFRLMHLTRRNVVAGARLRYAGSDSIDFIPGVDYLPDGRTGRVSAVVEQLTMLSDVQDGLDPGTTSVLVAGRPTEALLARLASAGVRVALSERPLRPEPASRASSGVGILQVTTQAVDRILAGAHPATPDRLSTLRLRRSLGVDVVSVEDAAATGINVVGYVPGKHPRLSSEAVLLCTHLDAVGAFAGVRAIDLENFGVPVAALIEVAAKYARFSRVTRIPERSLIVAVVAGGAIDSHGLRALLDRSPWEVSRIRDLVYIGTPRGGVQKLRDILAKDGPRLHAVEAGPYAFPDTTILVPGEPLRRVLQRRTGIAEKPASPRSYVRIAAVEAAELAETVYHLLSGMLMAGTSETPGRLP